MCYNNQCTLETAEVDAVAQIESCQKIALTIPARNEYRLVAGMTLSAMGVLAGLDVELLGDVRTVASECMDCLMHQAGRPQQLSLEAQVKEKRLVMLFQALERQGGGAADTLDLEITRGVLETLMPQVELLQDEQGVHTIQCSMPV